MKSVVDWDENYILHELPVGEYDWLDVKGRKALDLGVPNVQEHQVLDNLSKHISAFANSGGGQLIFGLKDPDIKAGRHFVDDGGIAVLLPKKGDTREWLENVIQNLVDLPLTKFNVYAIPHDPNEATCEIGLDRAIYIVDIGDSPNVPHQASDKRYYSRVAGRSQPISHRLVLDILNRRQHPQIELDFSIEVTRDAQPSRPSSRRAYNLVILAKNIGRIYAQFANATFRLPPIIMPDEPFWTSLIVEEDGRTVCNHYVDNTMLSDFVSGTASPVSYNTAQFYPILPGRARRWTIPLSFLFESVAEASQSIDWSVYADNASCQRGRIIVTEIPLKYLFDTTACPCCGAELIQNGIWNCHCDIHIISKTFLCPNCGLCTGHHCSCRSRHQ